MSKYSRTHALREHISSLFAAVALVAFLPIAAGVAGSAIQGPSGGGGTPPALPIEAARIEYGVIPNLFFSLPGVTVTAGGTTLGTNTLRAAPIVFGVDGTVSVLGIIVGIGVPTAVVRVGLYESGDDGMPSTLLVESGELDCSTNTRKLTTGLSAAVRADRTYWWAALGGTANASLIFPSTAERLPAILVTAASTTGALFGHLAVAQAYGALPATWPSGAATNAAVNAIPMPLIGVSR